MRLLGSGVNPNGYPLEFDNSEGFTFPVEGPYYEYPILSGGQVYEPGDRVGKDFVVFNIRGETAGLIMQTGASSSGFVECT